MGGVKSTRKTGKSGRPIGFARRDAVETAMNLVWKKGFLSVSVKELAEAMSIRRSSFYNTFGGREELFREVLAMYGTRTPDAPLDHVRPGEPVVPVIVSVMRDLCRARANDGEARGCLVCNGLAELAEVEGETGSLLAQTIRHRESVLERLLRQAVKQGDIPTLKDVRAAAKSFVSFLIGLNILSKVVRRESDLWAACRQYLSALGFPRAALNQPAADPAAPARRLRDVRRPGEGLK